MSTPSPRTGDDAPRRRQSRQIERQITSRLPEVTPHLRHAGRLVRLTRTDRLVANYWRDDADGLATIIAYSALFSLMPLLFTLFTILGLVVHSPSVYAQVQRLVESSLPAGMSDPVMNVVREGRSNTGEFGLVALVSYVIGGSRLFSALDRTFATIYHVPRRPWIRRKLAGFVMVPLVSLLAIAAAVAATVATIALAVPDRMFESTSPHWLTGVVTLLLSFALAFGVAVTLYSLAPSPRPAWRNVWKGSVVAAILFVVLGQLFPIYVQFTHQFSAFGSAFAFVLVFLIWLYLLGQIIVIGAEVNALTLPRD